MSSLKHFSTLKSTKEFNRVYNNSKTVHTSQFVLFFQAQEEEYKIGIVASKKVGNAVQRNRAKRLLRAHFLHDIDTLRSGHYILVAKPNLLRSEYNKTKQEIFKALTRLKATKK
ncbi:MAG TPA: ribonuclease P protein component [Campylobacterales bacterium]|nr:ribonuclease P protein component [Campylobacterales bacterium]HHS93235.1 ribonuclease P protein component [Campylobacterales bacterium]